MSPRERERMKALHEVQRGHLRQREVGGRLRLSAQMVRRLLRRVCTKGDRGLIHRLRGRRTGKPPGQSCSGL